MGKGDRKSKRGKIWRGTYGKKRPKYQAPVKPPVNPKEKEKTKQNLGILEAVKKFCLNYSLFDVHYSDE